MILELKDVLVFVELIKFGFRDVFVDLDITILEVFASNVLLILFLTLI